MQNQTSFTTTTVEMIKNINEKAKNSHDTVFYFDQCADEYDESEKAVGYSLHEAMVRFVLSLIEDGEIDNRESMNIIDVASGTGFVGEALRRHGFNGVIDATDGSAKMLEIAKSKKVYNNVFCHVMEKDADLPKEMTGRKYDVAIVCGALMRSNIIHQECLKNFVDFVRPGGLILFSIKNPHIPVLFEYKMEIEKIAFQLQQDKVWKLVDVHYVKSYRNSIPQLDEPNTMGQYLFCYKKM